MAEKDKKDIKALEYFFEDMFEKQVHDFIEEHRHLIETDKNIFMMAKSIEDRYNFVIEKAKEQVKQKIETVKKRNEEFYNMMITKRKKMLEEAVREIEEEIRRKMEEQKKIEEEAEKFTENAYIKNKEKIIEKGLKILGFDVL